jgi:hypothetical protein
MVLFRVEALGKRVEDKIAQSTATAGESPKKKTRTEVQTPAKRREEMDMAPPSTVRRVLSWVWGTKDAESTKDDTREKEDVFAPGMPAKGKERDPTERPKEMRQIPKLPEGPAVRGMPVKAVAVPSTTFAPALPPLAKMSASTTADVSSGSLLGLSTSSSATSSTAALQTPAHAPATHATTGGESVTAKLYPSLNPPIGQRSEAIRKLFPEMHPLGTSAAAGADTSFGGSSTSSTGAGRERDFGIRRKTSVRDLVKGFESSGELGALLSARRG